MSERASKAAQDTLAAAEQNKIVPLEFGGTSELSQRFTPQPIIRIHLLGVMRATSDLGASVLPRGRKARAILGYLCLASGERISRRRLAAMLWERVPDDQALTSFRQAFRELSLAMGAFARELLWRDRDNIRFDSSRCWIDVMTVLSETPNSIALRGGLASLCDGELLADFDGISVSFDHWLVTQRTRFGDRMRSLLEAELQQIGKTGADAERRALTARQVIGFEPTHEGASRMLMRALADMGERAQALQEYARCSEALRKTLDVEPSAETQALYQALRTFPRRGSPASNAAVPSPAAQRFARSPVLALKGNQLRVGVLPFRGGRSSDSENLASSLSQEIAAALARFRWFDVIAPVSLGRSRSGASIFEELLRDKQLDYLVEGELSGSAAKYQISVRLLDVRELPRPVWSDRFELPAESLDQIDELVTAPVVAQMAPVILLIEGRQKQRVRFGASGLVLQAISLMYSMEREKYEEAGRLLSRALDNDPENAMVAAWAAYWQVFNVGQGWTQNATRSLMRAQELAVKAIRSDPDNAEALGIYAHICAFLYKDFDSAVHYFERSLRLNPNLAFVWALSAATYCYIGKPENALQRLARYRRLAPSDPYFSFWESFYTIAYTFNGEYDKAAAVGRRAVRANPEFSNGYKPLIAALGHLGQVDEATLYLDKLLVLEPTFSIKSFSGSYPFGKEEDRERYIAGLRLAGVPES
jgi:DNA-binding SARP family transcriptional activator/TolB-like protein